MQHNRITILTSFLLLLCATGLYGPIKAAADHGQQGGDIVNASDQVVQTEDAQDNNKRHKIDEEDNHADNESAATDSSSINGTPVNNSPSLLTTYKANNTIISYWVRTENIYFTIFPKDVIELIIGCLFLPPYIFVGPVDAEKRIAISALQGTYKGKDIYEYEDKWNNKYARDYFKAPLISDNNKQVNSASRKIKKATICNPKDDKKTNAVFNINSFSGQKADLFAPFFALEATTIRGIAVVANGCNILGYRDFVQFLYDNFSNPDYVALSKSVLLIITGPINDRKEIISDIITIIAGSYLDYFNACNDAQDTNGTKRIGALKPFFSTLLEKEVTKEQADKRESYRFDNKRIAFVDPSIQKHINSALEKLYNLRQISTKRLADQRWFCAAKNGNKKLLAYIHKKFKINADLTGDENSGPALILSATNGHLDIVKFLVQKGTDIHAKDKYGNTPLLLSASNGRLTCVKYLLQQGADIHGKDKDGNTPLLLSASNGHLTCVKYLFQQGADINAKDKEGNTALILSAGNERLDIVKYLGEQGAEMKESTTLHHDAKKGNLDIVKFLVQKGTDIHGKDKDGNTPLLLSASNGRLTCVKYLLQQGADIHAKDKNENTPLLLSAKNGHIACVEYLVKQGADMKTKDKDENTPLLLSAKNGHVACVEYLVQQGANIKAINKVGNTALLLTAYSAGLNCLKHLVQQKADIHHKNRAGNTVLIEIVIKYNRSDDRDACKCVDYAKYLVQQDVDTNWQGKQGMTALELAREQQVVSHDDMINVLLAPSLINAVKQDKGLLLDKILEKDYRYRHNQVAWIKAKKTTLIWSVKEGKLEIVKYLVKKGADITCTWQGEESKTALEWATKAGHSKVVKFISEVRSCLTEPTLVLLTKLFSEYNLDVNQLKDRHGDRLLILSVKKGNLNCVKYLVERGAYITSYGRQASTALQWAQEAGQTDVAEFLSILESFFTKPELFLLTKLSKEYDLDVRQLKDKHGNTPLILSAKEGTLDFVKYLVEEGADIKAKNKDGYTALIWSARNGHLACVEYLVQQGVDIKAKNKDGYTPLIWSAYHGHLACVKYLVQQGADINTRDNDGYTPLIWSAYYGHLACVKYLVQQGADITCKNNNDYTALQYTGQSNAEALKRVFLLKKQ